MKCTILAAVLAVTFLPTDAAAQTPFSDAVANEDQQQSLFFAGPVPRNEFTANDARLNDVCGVGQSCFAVGERGTVVISIDAGETWTTTLLPVDCSLQSVCFLTNQIGFLAGSYFDTQRSRHRGLICRTTDGGVTWKSLSEIRHTSGRADLADIKNSDRSQIAYENLPPLSLIRFFDLENALAVGTSGGAVGRTVVLRTRDAGATWTVLKNGSKNATWIGGDFLAPHNGVLVGRGNATSALVGDEVMTIAEPQRILQNLRDVSVSDDGTGWIAGDGNLLLQSTDNGVSWQPPAGKLSPLLSNLLDYRTVDHRNDIVCAAGSPGSIVLHSSNAGRSWTFRQITNGVPIHRLRFTGESTVLAVGGLGVIHRSTDRGLTWATVRNKDYRTAILCLTTDAADVSFRMLANISGEQGFRSVVVQPSASLPKGDSDERQTADLLRRTVPMTGCDDFVQDWMFSRSQPLQHLVRNELLKTWAGQTDGKVSELLPLRLARLIRTWRPDAITLESGLTDDQLVKIWLDGAGTAISIATGEDERGKLLDRIGLAQWKQPEIFVRLSDGSQSSLTFRGSDVLSRTGTTSGLISDYCKNAAFMSERESSMFTPDTTNAHNYRIHASGPGTATPSHLLAHNPSPPGSLARRRLMPPRGQRDLMLNVSKRHQTERAAIYGHLRMSKTPLDGVAALKNIGRGQPDRLALQQLTYLATLYDSLDDLDGEIAVLNEITHRFPGAPESAKAAERLFQFYSSEELRFLRRNSATQQIIESGSDLRPVAATIPGVPTVSGDSLRPSGNVLPANGISVAPDVRPGSSSLLNDPNGADTDAVDEVWNRKALAAFDLMKEASPHKTEEAQILLRQAANARRIGTLGVTRTILSDAAAQQGFFALAARAELQAVHGAAVNPLPVINLPQNQSRPFLDGDLTDECWQSATELHLRDTAASNSAAPDCLMMLGWDNEFIYLAARVEYSSETHAPLDKTAERHHDATHGIRDRVEVSFDTDRDYTTGFRFTVDEAGQTSDYCWRSRRWNPKWFVAEAADDNVWRFEAAIPQNELQTRPIRAGDLWVVNLRRLAPGITEQTLVNDSESRSDASTRGFGLLRFIRHRK